MVESIVNRLKDGNKITESIAATIIAKKKHYSAIKFDGYRICDNKVFTIDTLYTLLNNSQIDTLFNSEDATLKFVSFILFARRNNDKKLLTAKLNNILENKYYQMISDGDCNHAILISDLSTFAYEALTRETLLFKPSFKFTKREKQYWENRLEEYRIRSN
ncbi:hypothetical protein GCM10027043_51740 [Ferruginibacter profundus]